MSSVIVEPQTANVMNAVMCGLMSFGLLVTPQKFMQGGAYQKPWFQNLPEARDNRLYYLGQFMSFLMLGGCLVPTLMDPSSQFLCYQMVLIHAVNIVHTLIFMCSSAYENARPVTNESKGQWYFMTVLSFAFFIVTVLAASHSTDNVVDSRETRISKSVANTVMLCFSSVFGVLFISVPRLLLSFFWSDEQDNAAQPNTATAENAATEENATPVAQEEVKTVMGFKLLEMTDHEKWWARCIGTTILCLNLAVGIDANIHQPLYTAGSLVTVSTLTLLNFHQVVMRPYKSISNRQILLSWVPNLIMSAVVIGVLTSAVLLA